MCDETLSRMIEIWMRDRLVSDNNLQHSKSIIPQFFLQGTTNNVRLTLSVCDTTPGFTIVLSKAIRIDDTTYDI